MRATSLLLFIFATACASGPALDAREPEAEHALPAWRAPARAETADVEVSGLVATLGAVDVRQVMERRQDELLACLDRPGRPLTGEVRFGFVVRPDGGVRTVRIERSTLGHRGAERCLSRVARRTLFPQPQGAGDAEASWTMIVGDALVPERRTAKITLDAL